MRVWGRDLSYEHVLAWNSFTTVFADSAFNGGLLMMLQCSKIREVFARKEAALNNLPAGACYAA